jgi:hypothetical protein
MWMSALGSRTAHTLQYLAAVRDDWREDQPCLVRDLNTLSSPRLGPAQVTESVAWVVCLPTESGSWKWSSSLSARQVAMHELS